MTTNKYPPRKGPTKFKTPNSFRRQENCQNQFIKTKVQHVVSQHRA